MSIALKAHTALSPRQPLKALAMTGASLKQSRVCDTNHGIHEGS